MTPQEFLEQFKKQSEGKLFRHIAVLLMKSETAFYMEHYYVVRNGVIFSIHPPTMKETATKDNFYDLMTECEELGEFEECKQLVVQPNTKYKSAKSLKSFFEK